MIRNPTIRYYLGLLVYLGGGLGLLDYWARSGSALAMIGGICVLAVALTAAYALRATCRSAGLGRRGPLPPRPTATDGPTGTRPSP